MTTTETRWAASKGSDQVGQAPGADRIHRKASRPISAISERDGDPVSGPGSAAAPEAQGGGRLTLPEDRHRSARRGKGQIKWRAPPRLQDGCGRSAAPSIEAQRRQNTSRPSRIAEISEAGVLRRSVIYPPAGGPDQPIADQGAASVHELRGLGPDAQPPRFRPPTNRHSKEQDRLPQCLGRASIDLSRSSRSSASQAGPIQRLLLQNRSDATGETRRSRSARRCRSADRRGATVGSAGSRR